MLSAEAGTPARIQPAKTTGCHLLAPTGPRALLLADRRPIPWSSLPGDDGAALANPVHTRPPPSPVEESRATAPVSRATRIRSPSAVKASLRDRHTDVLAALGGIRGKKGYARGREGRGRARGRGGGERGGQLAERAAHQASRRRVASSSPSGPSSRRCSKR